jgi:N-methylhydantoinase A
VRVGIDVGGTFTDTVSVDEETGQLEFWKRRTTYDQLSRAVTGSLADASARSADIDSIFHGTTLVSNAIVQRRGAATGVIATRGFRDLLEIRRNLRQHLYDLYWDKPPTLVRRMLRREVNERLDASGAVVEPLDEDSVREAVRFLKHKGVSSYAVCLLFSFRNQVHELRVREIIEEEHPGADVTLSSELAPEIREYERTSTVTLNAMVKPLIRAYLDDLTDELASLPSPPQLYIMKANGGVARSETIRARAVETFASGPAAGVTAAVALSGALDLPNLITFDVGGTTTDVSIVWQGRPLTTIDAEVEWSIPVRIPMIWIRSVGAGGGSIAWVDRGGALRVGPQSAGSAPGPVAYGWGGTAPTVTDACLVLGRLPARLLAGSMELDIEASRAAIDRDVSSAFDWSTEASAEAILRIALVNTVQLVREMTIGQGYDPRDFTLLAYGGNGPLLAAEVARELDISSVVTPQNAAVFSALGCLYSDIRHEYVRTILALAEPVSDALAGAVADAYEEMRDRARDDLRRDAVAAEPTFEAELELRYVGEAYELRVRLDLGDEIAAAIADSVAAFHREHERLYGFRRDDPVELVNARLSAVVALRKPGWASARSSSAGAVPERTREVRADGRTWDAAVCTGTLLRPGQTLHGPAVVEDPQTTHWVPPRWQATVDSYGNLRLRSSEEEQ